jgi:hypothetical protein
MVDQVIRSPSAIGGTGNPRLHRTLPKAQAEKYRSPATHARLPADWHFLGEQALSDAKALLRANTLEAAMWVEAGPSAAKT